MNKHLIVALAMFCIAINTHGQVLQTNTARSYLPTSTVFNQSQIDSFNSAVNYQADIINGSALSYPDLTPIQLTWDGTVWTYPTPVAVTNSFGTPLMVGVISHQASATPGATNPSILVDWADVPGVTQYRFRFRQLGGTWNASTITGSQRAMNTLAYNTTYECQVRVYINSTTQGEYTTTYTFTTPTFIPLPVCNAPSVNGSITNNTLSLNWSSVAQGVAYQVEVRQLGALSWGGTLTPNTNFTLAVIPNTTYEYRVRTNCSGASTTWSQFSVIDTAINSICNEPIALYHNGNTFGWTSHPYAEKTQIQHRLVGTTTWGGTTVTGNSFTNPILWGQHEWRVRSTCHSTSNVGWTLWATATTNFIPKPNSVEVVADDMPYPNPATDVIRFNGSIEIRDIAGRIIAKGENEVDVHQLVDGLYLVNGRKHLIRH